MSNLPELLNIPIELEINGVKIQARRAGFNELALLEEFNASEREKNPNSANLKFLPYALYLCIKKVYEDVTLDYVNNLLPAVDIMADPKLSSDILEKLGFIMPPKKKAEEKK